MPASGKCKNQTAAVNISDISFIDISGTFIDNYAGSLLCSDSSPCRNVLLQNISLSRAHSSTLETTDRTDAAAQPAGGASRQGGHRRDSRGGWDCWQVEGSSSNVSPPPCI